MQLRNNIKVPCSLHLVPLTVTSSKTRVQHHTQDADTDTDYFHHHKAPSCRSFIATPIFLLPHSLLNSYNY